MNAKFAKFFNINANAVNLSDKNSALNLNALANVSLNSAELCLANGGGGKSRLCFSTALCFLSFVCFSLFFKRSKNSIYTQKCFQALVIANERGEVWQFKNSKASKFSGLPRKFFAKSARNDALCHTECSEVSQIQHRDFSLSAKAQNDNAGVPFYTLIFFHTFSAIFHLKFNSLHIFTPNFCSAKTDKFNTRRK